ncbi:MAG TPA: DUF6600 domain-containing protein [Candidatus Limnocylindria bacterium]|nr:DUF6600 domain-containing protein [Candidatus Limnocylindria bacterium]
MNYKAVLSSRIAAFASAILVAFQAVQAGNTAAIADVIKLKNTGLGDDIILSFIQKRNLDYALTTDDLVTLKQQGVSSAVLNAMLGSGRGAAPLAPAAPSAPFAPVAPLAPAAGQTAPPGTLDPDAAYFYQELSPYGHWLMAEDNQWYWQPTVVVTSPAWRPYSDAGHWVSSDTGWYWSSDYPWGWAAFHYGRWQLHPHFGWIWLPDREWGPAWVVWRNGGDYCGWAPLPPGAIFDTGAGRFKYHGRLMAVDYDFGLDWLHFNFCFTRELGQPHWRPFIGAEGRGIFEHTRMLAGYRTGRTVIHGETRVHFFNAGIEVARVSALRGAPVEVVKIQDLRAPAGHEVHERFVPEEKSLQTYRPGFGPKSPHRR